MHRVGWLVLTPLAFLGSCSSDASPTAGSTPSSTSSTRPEGASATITVAGDGVLNDTLTTRSVRCSYPVPDGLSIAVLANTDDGSAQLRLSITAENVTVHIGSAGDSDYHERSFAGSGVIDFDPKTGATVDATLTESPPSAGITPGTVGAVTSIKGTVDCAGQDPGTTTLTATGDTGGGVLTAAPLESARIECYNPGDEVIVQGIIDLGTMKAFAEYGLRIDGVNLRLSLPDGTQHAFQGPPGSADLTGTSGSADGDAVEQGVSNPHTLHIVGDAHCGTPVG